jgi:acyl-coenzyme A thioesterase 9
MHSIPIYCYRFLRSTRHFLPIFRLGCCTPTTVDAASNRRRSCVRRNHNKKRYMSTVDTDVTTISQPNDESKISSSNKADTISVSIFKNPIVHELWTARQRAKQELQTKLSHSPNHPLTTTTTTTSVTQPQQSMTNNHDPIRKPPQESFVEVSYPFSTDTLLWEAYRNPWGQMRLGRLFEDLDALAGNIAFFHVHTNNNTIQSEQDYPIIVTASVDRIRLRHRPQAGSDQKLSGQVTWTGTSSMEIRMQCTCASTTSSNTRNQQGWLEAYVTFVTLDPRTKKPMRIPGVLPETANEKSEFAAGEARAAARKSRRHLHNQSIQSESQHSIDTIAKQLMIESGPLLTMPSLADPHAILLKDTVMQNAMIAQPQSSNLHNRVFGGFLIRRAFELAYSNAYLFGGTRPIFLEVDEISFASPVDVGDLLVFYSRILFTENNAGPLSDYYQQDDNVASNPIDLTESVSLMHVEVEAWVTEPEKVSARMSNQFYFTFATVKSSTTPKVHDTNENRPRIRKVLPSNIDEARRMATRMHLEAQQKKLDNPDN